MEREAELGKISSLWVNRAGTRMLLHPNSRREFDEGGSATPTTATNTKVRLI